MQQFVDGYISLYDINGGYIGSLQNADTNTYEFMVEDISEVPQITEVVSGCYRSCFFATYHELKSDCQNDIYCDAICDYAPCRMAWAYQPATTCMRICRPLGNI